MTPPHETAAHPPNRCERCGAVAPLKRGLALWLCADCDQHVAATAEFTAAALSAWTREAMQRPVLHTAPQCSRCRTRSNVVTAARLCLGCATALQEIGKGDQAEAARLPSVYLRFEKAEGGQ